MEGHLQIDKWAGPLFVDGLYLLARIHLCSKEVGEGPHGVPERGGIREEPQT